MNITGTHPRLHDPRRPRRPGARARGLQPPVRSATASMRCWCRRRCRPRDLAGFVAARACRPRNIDGLWLTIPHKAGDGRSCWTAATALGRIAGAVNAVRRNADGSLEGALFDGVGFVKALDHFGIAVAGPARAGGRRRAAAAWRSRRRWPQRGVGARWRCSTPRPGARRRAGRARCAPTFGVDVRTARPSADPAGYDLVVNATPLGLKAGDPLPFDPARVDAGAAVVDILMKNQPTPLLRACQARGIAAHPGFEMLVQQVPEYLALLRLRRHRARRAGGPVRSARAVQPTESTRHTIDPTTPRRHPMKFTLSPPRSAAAGRRLAAPRWRSPDDQDRRLVRSCRAPAPPPAPTSRTASSWRSRRSTPPAASSARRSRPRSPTRRPTPAWPRAWPPRRSTTSVFAVFGPVFSGSIMVSMAETRARRDPQLHRRRGRRDHAAGQPVHLPHQLHAGPRRCPRWRATSPTT